MARRVLHDEFFRKAKAEGYLARSAYKLKELKDRKKMIQRGDLVLDLGCAPGSWLQVASELAGESGVVVGIDLKPVDRSIAPNVRTVVGDITQIDPKELVDLAGGPFDVVVSDMAPNTSGAGDSERSVSLCYDVLAILKHVLRPSGNLAMKVLEGGLYKGLLDDTGELFNSVRGFKPKASRDASTEMYIVAHGYKGPLQ